LEEARKYINAANDKLGGTIIEEKGLGDRIEIQRPPNEFSPVSGRVSIYAGEEVLFKLVTDPKIDEIDKITWLIDDLTQEHGSQFQYKPQKRGIFRLKVMWKKKDTSDEDDLPLTLEIVRDPVAVSTRWVWTTALMSGFVWAAIATVAGLVYISARIPTFGSEMDYILAIAWAFGLSTVAQPTESIISGIMNRLAPDTKESESGNNEQSQNEEQNQRKTETTDKVIVPGVIKEKRDDAKSKLSEAGLIAKFEPDDAGADWIVESMRPEANTKVEKNTIVHCTLIKPSSGGDGGNKIDGDPGDA
jgi:hypothetical protein